MGGGFSRTSRTSRIGGHQGARGDGAEAKAGESEKTSA
jgi:hypothetical protein